MFVASSLMVGAAVSTSGLIGFVGLVVPHALRLVVGADHRLLVPASALAGASFLVLCDLASRLMFPVLLTEAPVGVVTALVGAPAFVWLLRRGDVRCSVKGLALAAHNVRFGYVPGREVLSGLTLELPAGAFTAVLGPNGSGKTSLLRVLSGAGRPWAGDVLLGTRPVRERPRRDRARVMAVVPQHADISFPFTVAEVVLHGRTPYLGRLPFERREDREAAQQAMAAADVAHLAARIFQECSGGEQRRVLLARALAQGPSVLLLDELAAHLDLRHQVELYERLRELHADQGLTIAIVSHDLNLPAQVCPDAVLMDGGRVVATGPVDEVVTEEALARVFGVAIQVGQSERTGKRFAFPIAAGG